MDINIMIPVLNEEVQLEGNVKKVVKFLDRTLWKGNYVITVADNGSTDRTSEIGVRLQREYNGKIHYMRLEEKGVGLAFRETIRYNKSDIVGYMDLDLATDMSHLNDVFKCFEAGTDIVVGSRLLKDSQVVGRSFVREVTSRGLNILMKVVLGIGFTDAMCGFKFYRKKTADRLIEISSNNNGWFYCAEMLVRAEWEKIEIKEIAVVWRDDPNSKVKIGKLSMNYIKEIRKLFMEKIRNKQGTSKVEKR